MAETQQREATAAEQVDKASKMSGGAMNTTSSLKAKIDELEKTVLSSRRCSRSVQISRPAASPGRWSNSSWRIGSCWIAMGVFD